jgi:hypothetical protein
MRYVAAIAMLFAFAGCATERNRVIYQRYAGFDNYCHTKVETPARGTINPSARDVVDYYGPCDAFD